MKKILVLGGTGAMGTHLVQLLAEEEAQICVTTRTCRESVRNIEYIQGNAREDSFLVPLLERQWDAIVDFMVYSTSEFNQRLPRLLTATSQYVFLSSARVYADSPVPIKENSPRLLDTSIDTDFLATDEYSLAKARQEDILRLSGKKNWTILRPYITYSERRMQLGVLEKEGWLYRALKGRAIVFSEDIACKLTTLTHGYEVAAVIVKLIGVPQAYGETYHITTCESVTWREVLDIYLTVLEEHLGKRPNVVFLDIEELSHCTQAKYQIKYDRLFKRTFDNRKVAEIVTVPAFHSVKRMLENCLNEFLQRPEFLSIDWRSEAIKDRHCGESASFAEIEPWKQKLKYFYYRFIKI